MSAPAMKVAPEQRSTIALTLSSASAAAKLSSRPWRTCQLSALTGGLLTMMTATSPSFSIVTETGVSSDMFSSLIRTPFASSEVEMPIVGARLLGVSTSLDPHGKRGGHLDRKSVVYGKGV